MKMQEFEKDKIITSASLHAEMNAERVSQGECELPAVNPCRGGTSTLARKDKSWKSVPDFFIQLFRKEKQ